MPQSVKKIKYVWLTFRWFVLDNLLHSEIKKVGHLFLVMLKHCFGRLPYAAIIETGNTCNFQCATCPTPHKLIHSRRPPMMMGLAEFKKIIDHIKKYVHIIYVYNSNEPLLNPDIVEMIKYANSANLHTMISTNASLLSEEKARAILNSGLGEIRFALDGLTKQSFEAFRRGGNFEQVIGNIRRFCRIKQEMKKHRPIVTLQFILNRYNQEQIPDIKKFAKEIKADKLYIKPFILSPYAYTEEERKVLARKFFPTKDIFDEEIVYKKENEDLLPKKLPKKCPAVKRVFTVLANGEMVMCCFDLFGDYSYGNLIEKDFKTLWFSEKAKKIRGLAYKRSFPLCQKCGNIE